MDPSPSEVMESIRQEVVRKWSQSTNKPPQRPVETNARSVDLWKLIALHEIRETRQMGESVRLRGVRKLLHREVEHWLLQDSLLVRSTIVWP
jgi:hypothetical protein